MMTSASSGTTSQTICSMISRDSLAMASYSGPRAPMAAIFWSTAVPTAADTAADTVGGNPTVNGRGVAATAGPGENSGDGVPPPPNALGTTAGRGGAEASGAGVGRASGGDDDVRDVPGMGTLAAGRPMSVRETGVGARAAGPAPKAAGRTGIAPGREGATAPGRMPGISDGRMPPPGGAGAGAPVDGNNDAGDA